MHTVFALKNDANDLPIFTFGGASLWSNETELREIRTEKIEIEIVNDPTYGSWAFLSVYFNKQDWDVKEDGLIYTDSHFEEQVIEYMKNKFGVDGLGMSEQGMQGNDFVHFDFKYDDAQTVNLAVNTEEDPEASEYAF